LQVLVIKFPQKISLKIVLLSKTQKCLILFSADFSVPDKIKAPPGKTGGAFISA